jgi:hypothetical protein
MAPMERSGQVADGSSPAPRARATADRFCTVAGSIAFRYSPAGLADGAPTTAFMQG